MNFQGKVLVMILCGLFLSGCMVSKAKLDEATAKIAQLESDGRGKDQEIVSHDKEIASLEAANRTLTANVEKEKQFGNETMAKARVTQELSDAEILKVKGEVVAKSNELLAFKEETAKKMLEKDKESEELIYSIREIQARTESLLEKIKSIR